MRIALVLMTCLSGILLGLSQGNNQLMAIACGGAIAGWLIVDVLRLFQLQGWVANAASIGILIYAMSDFFGGDGASKLISTSKLLVYLQTVLMFQEKTVRLNWQVMVLSLLQAVVAAIFNVDFEGGLLFVVYFGIAGTAMVLQSNMAINDAVIRGNRESAKRLRQRTLGTADQADQALKSTPIAIFDFEPQRSPVFKSMIIHLSLWLAMGMMFTTLLFYSIPRTEKAWFGPKFRKMAQTGFANKVDLDQQGKIEQSGELVARVQFFHPQKEEQVSIAGPIYVRGMALASLKIQDGNTTWVAPYDRLHSQMYEAVPTRLGGRSNLVRTVFTLEATQDPLIYVSLPVCTTVDTPHEIEFCHDLSAFTRVNASEQIEFSPYEYEFLSRTADDRTLLDSWPYRPELSYRGEYPLTRNQGQTKWLTYLDRTRYPKLIELADEFNAEFERSGRTGTLEKMKALEQYFLDPSRYQYTMDFTNVPRQQGVDPIEDFAANHRTGHCELFASAMVLMLRHLGIPSRLVVGFYTQEYSDVTESYMVRNNNAHAWVEAYLSDDECTTAMVRSGGASRQTGAWVRLDPTPPVPPNTQSESTIELARTLWQDYVLGLDKSNQPTQVAQSTTKRMLGLFDLTNWSRAADSTIGRFSSQPLLQALLILAVLVFIVIGMIRNYMLSLQARQKTKKRGVRAGLLRRVVGSTLGMISPRLEEWILGRRETEVVIPYYQQLMRLLARYGFEKLPHQTQQEFAHAVSERLASRGRDGSSAEKKSESLESPTSGSDSEASDSSALGPLIGELTQLFYRHRFGGEALTPEQRDWANEQMKHLELALQKR